MSKRLLTMGGATVLFAFAATAAPAAAIDLPEPGSSSTVTEPSAPNYPEYAPQYEVPSVVAEDTGVDASSAALGALAGIAVAGAGLGAAFAIARHRDHPAAPQSA